MIARWGLQAYVFITAVKRSAVRAEGSTSSITAVKTVSRMPEINR